MDFTNYLHSSLLLLLIYACRIRCSMYQCLIPLQHCLGPLLPIGYAMQNVDMVSAMEQLNQQCPNLGSVESCVQRFPCSHDASRRQLDAVLWFFNWLCRNTHVLEANSECWEFPFDNDVISCGERYIAGEMGSRLSNPNHPCPYVHELVVCVREKMLVRRECSERATELYINIVIQSSLVFSFCGA